MNIFTKLTILSLFLLSFQCTYVDKEISKSQKKKKKFLKSILEKKVVYLNLDLAILKRSYLIHHTKYIFIKKVS